MTSSDIDKSQIRYARLAGFMYLLVDAAYLTFVLVTTRFRVPGDFAETAHRITGSELLYRIGLSSGLVASLCIVLLAMGLYVAIKPLAWISTDNSSPNMRRRGARARTGRAAAQVTGEGLPRRGVEGEVSTGSCVLKC